jgi:hypothetical protein
VLRGVVRSTQGTGLEGANVLLRGFGVGAVTDSAGRYEIAGVRPGKYDVLVRMIGYRPGTATATLGAGGVAEVDVTLESVSVSLSSIETDAGISREAAELPEGKVAGCYNLRLGAWSPKLDAPYTDMRAFTPPSRVVLDTVVADEPMAYGFAVRPASGVAPSVHRYAYWTPLTSDSLRIVWSDGTAGIDLRAKRVRDGLRGTATTFTDDERRAVQRTVVRATRQRCPE